jgi:lipid A 3-O-deacylase
MGVAGERTSVWARRRGRGAAVLAVAVVAGLAAAPLAASETTAVASFGLVGAKQHDEHSAVLDLEYRFRPWRWGIGPVLGAAMTSHGDAYLRAGIGRDVPLGERWNVHLSSAAGGYHRGNGKDLGRGLEFRSAIDVSVRVRPGVRLGAALAHLSNASIGRSNPGIEHLTVTLSFVPARFVKRR